jgi:acetyl esterase/lipase
LSRLAQTEDEAVEQPAQQIAAVVRVLARADTFVKLAQQQAVLAQMLQRFADRTNALSRIEQMEVQELAHQQRRVQEGLHTLLAQLPELLAKVPADADYDPLRRDVNAFLKAVADAKIEEDLGHAAGALDAPDTMTGHALAQRAAEKMDRLIARCNELPGEAQQCLTARFQPKLSKPGLGNSLQQILAAMGVGTGETGRDGYGLFNEDVALYGPNVELAGEQAGRRGDTGSSGGQHVASVAGDARDPGLQQPDARGRVRLQPDAKFPLRYRDLVGEYFRVIAESEKEGDK